MEVQEEPKVKVMAKKKPAYKIDAMLAGLDVELEREDEAVGTELKRAVRSKPKVESGRGKTRVNKTGKSEE